MLEARLTVEFRNHSGIIDRIRATIWIKVEVRIIEFVRDMHVLQLSELLKVIQTETREKLGDGGDDEREAKFGRIIAEEAFTG